ncbi:adipokinetic hormone/corazonin-related peptide receptor variant I-like isoform X2 [Oratosquilla oratoria]|uniref:adipokinetic hormone/corazonin-related peptide receptor variant I-like isoform X2 n=1 Tax=Oratosquilla oratoria TaxID=337810 RepID=UPI003F762D19
MYDEYFGPRTLNLELRRTLQVTAVMIPVEVGWAATVEWTAGDGLCRLFAFFRIFGHYLSSFVLVCISIDRYFAVVHPMSLNAADRRGRIMLGFAWCLAVTCSLPQVIIFHVESHPEHTHYVQCVTFNFYPTDQHEMAYNLFCLIMLYVAPLALIVALYGAIVVTIFQKSRLSADDPALRRSSVGFLGRARVRTIKMTVSIVAAFFVCWTPYVIISLWFCFDRKAAERLDLRVQKALFIFACTNSCANPIVYGIFNFCKGNTPKTQTWRSNASRTTHFSRSLTGRRRMSGGGGGGGGGISGWGRPDSLADSSEATELTAELQPRGLSTPGEPRSVVTYECTSFYLRQTPGATRTPSGASSPPTSRRFHRCSCRGGKEGTTPTITLTTSRFKNGAFFSAAASCPLHPHANGSAL